MHSFGFIRKQKRKIEHYFKTISSYLPRSKGTPLHQQQQQQQQEKRQQVHTVNQAGLYLPNPLFQIIILCMQACELEPLHR